MSRALPFAALLVLSAAALAIDLTMPLRLPSTAEQAEAAGFLRGHARPGDVVVPWPPFLERSRAFVDAAPVEIEEDLARADFAGVSRVWLWSAPRAPFARVDRAEAALVARGGRVEGEAVRFGALSLQAFALPAPPMVRDFTGVAPEAREPEFHEVDFVAHRCRRLPLGPPGNAGTLSFEGPLGRLLHLRAGIIGENAYDLSRAAVAIELEAGAVRARLEVPTTVPPEPGWRGVDLPIPEGTAGTVTLRASSATPGRPVCFSLWSTG